MEPKEIAKAWFKRNPKADACHVVLDKVFGDMASAKNYQKAFNANCVSSFLKAEVEAEVEVKAKVETKVETKGK